MIVSRDVHFKNVKSSCHNGCHCFHDLKFLLEKFSVSLCNDVFASYDIHELDFRQVCISHMFRKVPCSLPLSVETEEAALLHEEATMTIEELLARYGQNLNADKHTAAIR